MQACFALLLLIVCSVSMAGVSPKSAELDRLRIEVEKQSNSSNELQYLNAFPSTFENFRKTFYGKDFDELYETHLEHLQLLGRLQGKYPERVLNIWLGVATNGYWDADAIGFLQQQIASWGAHHTKELASALRARSEEERKSIIRFLADVENHRAYTDYTSIEKNLEIIGDTGLLNEFAMAKTRRIQRRDH